MLTLTKASLARTEELFKFKVDNIELPPFPGYTSDQWGIKAHNRSYIINAGNFQSGERVIEVGGAYSTLPRVFSRYLQC